MLRSGVKTADVRETRQCASERYLELLVNTLCDVDNEEDDTSIEQICVRVKLSVAPLKLYHSKIHIPIVSIPRPISINEDRLRHRDTQT